MKKKFILTENQVKKLLEMRVNDFNLEGIVKHLESIECTGDDLKYLVKDVLFKYGYEDISVIFLGYEEKTKNLKYIAYTEGPIFIYKTKSDVSIDDRPCLTIYDVKAYQEI